MVGGALVFAHRPGRAWRGAQTTSVCAYDGSRIRLLCALLAGFILLSKYLLGDDSMTTRRSALRNGLRYATIGLSTFLILCTLSAFRPTDTILLVPPGVVLLDIGPIWIGDPCVAHHEYAMNCHEKLSEAIEIAWWSGHLYHLCCTRSRCSGKFD
jgi:hypothetical protein